MDRIVVRGRPKIILAEDHALVRCGIEKLLERDYELVGVVSDGRELVKQVIAIKPDIAIVDIGLPILNGIEAAREIRKEKLATRIIFLSMHTEPDYAVEALRAGGSGYVPKHAPPEELHTAIREALFGRIYVSPMIPGGVFDLLRRREEHVEVLTSRQRQVVQMVAEGFSSREIAGVLSVSVKTIEFHRANIMDRLGVRTTAELTRYAIQQGLLSEAGNLPRVKQSGN